MTFREVTWIRGRAGRQGDSEGTGAVDSETSDAPRHGNDGVGISLSSTALTLRRRGPTRQRHVVSGGSKRNAKMTVYAEQLGGKRTARRGVLSHFQAIRLIQLGERIMQLKRW